MKFLLNKKQCEESKKKLKDRIEIPKFFRGPFKIDLLIFLVCVFYDIEFFFFIPKIMAVRYSLFTCNF